MSEDFVVECLELVAEKAGDITPVIYEKYFERCPDSAAVMSHLDETTMGKMMDEVYRLIMVADCASESDYLNWEVVNHEFAYSVEPHMYEGLFAAMTEAVSEALGVDWNTAMESAWKARCDDLRREIVRRFTST